MSIPPCVPPARRRTLRPCGRLFRFLFACFLLLSSTAVARGDDTIVLAVSLNDEVKGDYFVVIRDDGGILMRTDDLQTMGFRRVPAPITSVAGAPMAALRELDGVDYRFEEETLTLYLTSRPELLGKRTVDLGPTRQPEVLSSRDDSLFLNYGIDYLHGGDGFDFQQLVVASEIGARLGSLVLLSDSLYTETPDDAEFVRLNSRLIRDWEDSFDRLIIGDFFAGPGELGHQAHLGGVSYSRIYDIDPYFISYPLFSFAGQLATPATVELHVNDRLFLEERFSPGEFELRNLQDIGGAQDIEVVIRDVFGREQRIRSPFYFTDHLLRDGLHEFSYNLGVLREDFGLASDRYGKAAASFFHRYGISDRLTVGTSGEARDGLINLGGGTTILLGNYGLVQLAAAGSSARGEEGLAGLFRYDYQKKSFRVFLTAQAHDRGYRTLAEIDANARLRYLLNAGVSYHNPRYGSFAVNHSQTENQGGSRLETWSLSWSRQILANGQLYVTVRRVEDVETYHETLVNLTWRFGRDHEISAGARREREARTQTLEARKNVPSGAGTGWSLYGERIDWGDEETRIAGGSVQHNARHAIVRGEYAHLDEPHSSRDDVRLSLAGSVVAIGGTVALARPVNDSFALVTIGESEGIAVYNSNQLVGHTDKNGEIVIPDLTSYYDNQVSIEDKDIPLEFLMPRVQVFVSPPLRSGSCLNFPLLPHRAFAGTLSGTTAGQPAPFPLALAEITVYSLDAPLTFQTDSRGEFYFDNEQSAPDFIGIQGCAARGTLDRERLPPGTYQLEIRLNGSRYSAELTLPVVAEPFTDLGEIILRLTAVENPPAPLLLESPDGS